MGQLESSAGPGTSGTPARTDYQRRYFNQRSGTVIALALTSRPQKAGFPLTLKLSGRQLPKEAWLKISQIRTLSTERLDRRIGRVEDSEVEQAIDGLNEIIGG